MCMSSPSMPSVPETLSQGNVTLSSAPTATGVADKTTRTTATSSSSGAKTENTGKKRNISSLRVPLKSTDTSTVGMNTNATATGLNIPV